MRENRMSGSEGGVAQTNVPFLPLSATDLCASQLRLSHNPPSFRSRHYIWWRWTDRRLQLGWAPLSTAIFLRGPSEKPPFRYEPASDGTFGMVGFTMARL